MENINWLKEFENIDIDKAIKLKLYKVETTDEKKNRVFEAAYNLTLQYLQAFKKETYLLSDSRKIEYINSLNIEKPKPQTTANSLVNMAAFEAQSNFNNFLNDYKALLLGEINTQETGLHKNIKLDAILESQNFLNPLIPMKSVYNHFIVLTQKTNKFNEFFLTNDQFLLFLKSTFIDRKPIKQKFNGKPNTKKEIRKIFYEFYYYNKKNEGNLTSVRRKYFDILNNSFEGFNENDYKDFNKT